MRVFWFSPVLPHAVCDDVCVSCSTSGGWIDAMLDGLAMCSDIEILVFTPGLGEIDCLYGRFQCVSFRTMTGERYYRRLQKLITDFNPDILHIHGTEREYGDYPQYVYGERPVVVSVQGVIDACQVHLLGGLMPDELRFKHHNFGFFLHGRTLYTEQRHWRNVRSELERQIFKRWRYFIGRTEWDKAIVHFLGPAAHYYSVNETLRRPFYRACSRSENILPHSIYCGASSGYPLKGLHWLLRAISLLKDEFPDISLRIAAAGPLGRHNFFYRAFRSGAYTNYLRSLILSLGLERHIITLPNLSDEEVATELMHAELFVSPSLCENSSNSICEAMLVGTPVVATDVGGTASMLQDGVEGWLVPSYDSYSLAAAIRDAFLRDDVRAMRASSAQARARLRHDPEINASALVAVYREIISAEMR